jgi:hypothetical protein
MPTQAIRAAGTLIKVRIAGVYTKIPDIRGFTGPGGEAGEIEVTPIDNTGNPDGKEFLTDLPDPGEFSWSMNYVPGNSVHQYLLTAWKAGTLELFEVTYVSGHVTSFSAFVRKLERKGEQGQALSADVSLRLSGAITDP